MGHNQFLYNWPLNLLSRISQLSALLPYANNSSNPALITTTVQDRSIVPSYVVSPTKNITYRKRIVSVSRYRTFDNVTQNYNASTNRYDIKLSNFDDVTRNYNASTNRYDIKLSNLR